MTNLGIVVSLAAGFFTIFLYRMNLNVHAKIISLISILGIILLIVKVLPGHISILAMALNGVYMIFYAAIVVKHKLGKLAVAFTGVALCYLMMAIFNVWPYASETKFAVLLPIILSSVAFFKSRLSRSDLMVLIIPLSLFALHFYSLAILWD